jgi:hypothetical protein
MRRYILHTMARKMVNISIVVWSLTRKIKYLHFNRNANTNPYCILFHDANPVSGHDGPLLYKKLSRCNLEEYDSYLSLMCKNFKYHWKCIMNKMHS